MVGQTVKRGLPFPSIEAARAMVKSSEGLWQAEEGRFRKVGSKHPFLHDMITKSSLCPAMNFTYDTMFHDHITLGSNMPFMDSEVNWLPFGQRASKWQIWDSKAYLSTFKRVALFTSIFCGDDNEGPAVALSPVRFFCFRLFCRGLASLQISVPSARLTATMPWLPWLSFSTLTMSQCGSWLFSVPTQHFEWRWVSILGVLWSTACVHCSVL